MTEVLIFALAVLVLAGALFSVSVVQLVRSMRRKS